MERAECSQFVVDVEGCEVNWVCVVETEDDTGKLVAVEDIA